jgi:hypothetical protein
VSTTAFCVPESLSLLLAKQEWSAVPHEMDGECALLVSVPRIQAWLLMALRERVRPEILPVLTGRGMRLRVRVGMKNFPHDPYAPVIDLNISKPDHRRMAEMLTRQASLKCKSRDSI